VAAKISTIGFSVLSLENLMEVKPSFEWESTTKLVAAVGYSDRIYQAEITTCEFYLLGRT